MSWPGSITVFASETLRQYAESMKMSSQLRFVVAILSIFIIVDIVIFGLVVRHLVLSHSAQPASSTLTPTLSPAPTLPPANQKADASVLQNIQFGKTVNVIVDLSPQVVSSTDLKQIEDVVTAQHATIKTTIGTKTLIAQNVNALALLYLLRSPLVTYIHADTPQPPTK